MRNELNALPTQEISSKVRRLPLESDPVDNKNIESVGDFELTLESLRSDNLVEEGLLLEPIPLQLRKPNRYEFFRVNPDPAYHLPVKIVEHQERGGWEKTTYLIHASLEGLIEIGLSTAELRVCVNRQGEWFLWPLKVGGGDNKWILTARQAMMLAQTKWIRMYPERKMGLYRIVKAGQGLDFPEPVFPEEPFIDIIQRAFEDRLVLTEDHPFVRKLQGYDDGI